MKYRSEQNEAARSTRLSRSEELLAIERAIAAGKFKRIEDPEEIIAHNDAREAADTAQRTARAKKAAAKKGSKPGKKAPKLTEQLAEPESLE